MSDTTQHFYRHVALLFRIYVQRPICGTVRCLIVTTGGCRTSLAGRMTVGTCCAFWTILG